MEIKLSSNRSDANSNEIEKSNTMITIINLSHQFLIHCIFLIVSRTFLFTASVLGFHQIFYGKGYLQVDCFLLIIFFETVFFLETVLHAILQTSSTTSTGVTHHMFQNLNQLPFRYPISYVFNHQQILLIKTDREWKYLEENLTFIILIIPVL